MFLSMKTQQCAAKLCFVLLLTVAGIVAAGGILFGQGDPPPVRVGGDVKPPVKVKDVKPVYPTVARQARMQGVVVIEATVGADGKVKATKVLKSVPALDAAAMTAVKQWEYRPTLVDGKATPVILPVALTFRLD